MLLLFLIKILKIFIQTNEFNNNKYMMEKMEKWLTLKKVRPLNTTAMVLNPTDDNTIYRTVIVTSFAYL